MKIRYPLLGAFLLAILCLPAGAQTYKNISNARFNTISNGPLQAAVVDVPNLNDSAAVSKAVAAKVAATRAARESIILRELDFLKKHHAIKPNASPGIPDIVVLRQAGRLAVPRVTRTRAGNDLTLIFPAPSDPGAWTPQQQQELQAIWNIAYPEMKNVYGEPSWSGNVKLINGDALTPIVSDRNAISGGVYNVSTGEITFAVYNSIQSKVLNLIQMMAIAFHGPASISYDAWERGMARAATVIVARNTLPILEQAFGAGNIDVSDPLFHALERYDWLNQQALGNDRFFPVSLTSPNIVNGTNGGMFIPRLQMSSSAWLKVATDNPGVFAAFNPAYYAALASDANLKNNVPALKALMATAASTVESLPFIDWYDRQYVLDTSVSIGDKLYADAVPLRPTKISDDDFSIAVFLVYYHTGFDTSGNSDETYLNGTSFPIYWDYTFTNRLFLAAQYERVDIRNGFGGVSPTFFNTIGGDPQQQGRMRIAMDFPVNNLTVRLYTAPRDEGADDLSPGFPPEFNNFWGAVVGADTGTINIQTDSGANATVDVHQGSFGGRVTLGDGSNPFKGLSRSTVTFTPSGGGQPIVRRVNTGYHEYVSVFYVADPVTSLVHTFANGPQMISFPIDPLKPKAADALLDPATGLPLFNDGNLLLAQWRQTLPGADKYLIYPSLDPIKPGQGYWSMFDQPVTAMIKGRSTAQDVDYTSSLIHGWNQIGDPYEFSIDPSALLFQHQADNVPKDLAGAIAAGWLVATNQVVIWDFDPARGYGSATSIDPWHGYWIRVLVPEGLSITFPNPTRAARLGRSVVTRAAAPTVSKEGWSLPITVRGPGNVGATAVLGMSPTATSGFDQKFDALAPPAFSRAVPSVAFAHPDWGTNAGDYYSEIRHTGSREPWELTVTTPAANQSYTLSWSNITTVPRSTRLVLIDTATGRRQYMHTSSSYTFSSGTTASRRFQVLPENHGFGTLRIQNLMAVQSRAGTGASSVQIAYELSAGADVTTEIRSVNGRTIRRLAPSRAAAAGVNQMLWDTKDDRAVAVPTGSYIIQITARTAEGESVKAIQPVIITR